MEEVLTINSRMLSNMTKTEKDIAIGTHLALETVVPDLEMYDKEMDKKKDHSLANTGRALGINIVTVLRNLVEDMANTNNLKPKQILNSYNMSNILRDEILRINDALFGKIRFYFYYINRHSEYMRYNKDKAKVIPKKYETLYRFMQRCGSMINAINKDNIMYRDTILPGSLILTSLSFDLLEDKVELLESHTGNIKSKARFNSKLHKLGTMEIGLPLNKYTIYTYGDRNFIMPYPDIKIKKKMLEVCQHYGVNYLTSDMVFFKVISREKELTDFIHKNLIRL
jgi:hypothetical protein